MRRPTKLRLGDKLTLPLDAVTRATAIVGQRGTGKTSTAVVLVEEAAAAGAQFVAIDPTGAWYGVRTSADGDGPGLQVVVFGGHNADVPLHAEHGSRIARLVLDENINAVIDLEQLTKGKQVQFVAEFCEELYHRNRTALLLVVDEAHRFAPQQLRDPGGYGARCLGAVTDVVTLGRRKGLGAALISQRPAKINKDVFEQAEVMVAHRLMGPNDVKAISGWLEEFDGDVDRPAGLQPSAVRGLDRGEAIVYAPTFDVWGRFHVRAKRTFDSSATPEVGATVVAPRGRADVDLEAIQQALADVIEAEKSDDPRHLRRQISELRAELASRPPAERIEIPVITDEARQALEQAATAINGARDHMIDAAAEASVLLGELVQQLGVRAPAPAAKAPALAPTSTIRPRPTTTPVPTAAATVNNGTINAPRQRILDTIAWFNAIGVTAPKRGAVAPLAGTTATSSGFEKNLSGLRSAGLIDYPAGGRLALTTNGQAIARQPDGAPTSEALQDAVLSKLNAPRAAILRALIAAYPDALTREELAERIGTSPSSSGYEKNLSGLRTLELIDYPARGLVAALPVLFLEEAMA